MPVIGLHSVILRPDSVRRVTPPTTITEKTSHADPISHLPTPGGDNTGNRLVPWVGLTFEEKNRGSKRVDFRAVVLTDEGRGCASSE